MQPEYTIRKATVEDIPGLLAIFEAAKEVMHSGGNPQWPGAYPGDTLLREDIAAGGSWLLESGGGPVATAALLFGIEPTYEKIYNGSWPGGDIPYATIHRVATHPGFQGGGVASALFAAFEKESRAANITSLRVDTHRANRPMQSFLAKHGFAQCGIIYLANGDERLAFEKLL